MEQDDFLVGAKVCLETLEKQQYEGEVIWATDVTVMIKLLSGNSCELEFPREQIGTVFNVPNKSIDGENGIGVSSSSHSGGPNKRSSHGVANNNSLDNDSINPNGTATVNKRKSECSVEYLLAKRPKTRADIITTSNPPSTSVAVLDSPSGGSLGAASGTSSKTTSNERMKAVLLLLAVQIDEMDVWDLEGTFDFVGDLIRLVQKKQMEYCPNEIIDVQELIDGIDGNGGNFLASVLPRLIAMGKHKREDTEHLLEEIIRMVNERYAAMCEQNRQIDEKNKIIYRQRTTTWLNDCAQN